MPRPKKSATLTRVTVSVDPADYGRMEELAKTSGLSTAFLIRKSMQEFLDRYEERGSFPVELKKKKASG